MAVLITGAAGFIGSNLSQRMVAEGRIVVGFDNLCRGTLANLASVQEGPRFQFEQVDLHDLDAFRRALSVAHDRERITEVWHMAANSDIPAGVADPWIDWRDTFMTTFHTLQLMKELEIGVMAFASTSAVYGDRKDALLTEDSGPLLPISNYGAMKLAAEAAVSAAVENYLEQAFIFRFPNVIGVPATHGVILDFIRRLREKPTRLIVLGNGTQQKPYLHVNDLLDAMAFIRSHAKGRLNYHNIGAQDLGITVRTIAEEVVAAVAPGATIEYGQENRGWVGDVPKFAYSVEKLKRLGWTPRFDSQGAVTEAIQEIAAQESRA